jgi:hypothetical protein
MMFAPLKGWRHVKVTNRHTALRPSCASPNMVFLQRRIHLSEQFERREMVLQKQYPEFEGIISRPRVDGPSPFGD